jgi:hypothetical protein
MGDLTRTQLRAEVTANLGGRSDLGSGDGLNTLNRALDRVQTRILRANSNGWSELKLYDTDAGLTADGNIYTGMPSNIDKIKSLLVKPSGLVKSYRLTRMLRSQWDSLIGSGHSDTTATGAGYYMDERDSAGDFQIRWYPTPNVDFTLYRYYTVKPTPFTANNSLSDFEDKDDLIIAGTTQYMFKRYQMFEEAEEWRKHFNVERDEAIRLDRLKPDVHAIPRGVSASGPMGANNPWQDPFVDSTSSGRRVR